MQNGGLLGKTIIQIATGAYTTLFLTSTYQIYYSGLIADGSDTTGIGILNPISVFYSCPIGYTGTDVSNCTACTSGYYSTSENSPNVCCVKFKTLV